MPTDFEEENRMRDSAAVKTLKQYYNDRLAPIDLDLLQKELSGTSDRIDESTSANPTSAFTGSPA